ncbi:hypothetical protein BH09BAC3_BH09BAC3_11320 [soil metagenome]
MKKIALAVSCLLFAFASHPVFAQDEKALIKGVIEKETDSFFNVDEKAWETTWLNTPYTYWADADSKGGNFVEGTENIKLNFVEYFKTAKPSKSRIERKWLEIRTYGTGAYVRFTQIVIDDIDRDETSEMRVLEKDKDGKWKIVCLVSTSK